MHCVYILTNKTHTVLYIGVTNNLERRIYEHKHHLVPGFTDRYHVEKLVYFETTNDIRVAIEREKTLKKWSRKKKEMLINAMNPTWEDLSEKRPVLFEADEYTFGEEIHYQSLKGKAL